MEQLVVVLWVSGALAAVGAGAVLGRRAVDRRAQRILDDGVRDVEQRVVDALGGTARLEVEGDPLRVLLGLREDRVPRARLVVERATLPNRLDVRRAELTTVAGADTADLVARITPRAISRQLGLAGLVVSVSRGRLRLGVGLAGVTVSVGVDDGRVVLRIPVAPPPIGSIASAGLTELVPRPPSEVRLHDVRIVDDELEVRAVVALHDLRALADRG